MAADLESEETCSPNEERVCGSQWPNVPISIVTSSDIIPLVYNYDSRISLLYLKWITA